jgi:MFS transporter, ceroid-lipofuscinosis neuronal protein 7
LGERTKAVSYLVLSKTFGFIFGPFLQGCFTFLGGDGYKMLYGLPLSMYTAPAWLSVILGLVNLTLFHPNIFKERKIAAREQMLILGKESEKETWKAIKPDYLVAWALIFSFFICIFNFVLLESIETVLTMDQFGWTKKQALQNMAYIMTAGGIVAGISFFTVLPLRSRIKENKLLIYGGFLVMILARMLLIPYRSETARLAYPKDYTFENGTHVSFEDDDPEVLGCPITQEWCKTTPVLGFPEYITGFLLANLG